MTIKEFAALCGCKPQTLRYYDKENLLKPAKVDAWTGYRYYDEEQALTFIKIKNLQKAGFTINEVKELLCMEDARIYQAFERKIAEAEEKVRQMKEIQRAYQTEMITMENKIESFRKLLKKERESYDPIEEFNLSPSSYEASLGMLDQMLVKVSKEGNLSDFSYEDYRECGPEAEEAYFETLLHAPDHKVIFERHGWDFAGDFLDELPVLKEEEGYFLLFRLNASKENKTAFASTMLGLCLFRAGKALQIGCTVIDSEDDENHFYLVTYQKNQALGLS